MLREQDLRVNVTLNEAEVPDAGIVFELGVVALAKDGTTPTQTLITQKTDFSALVADSEQTELSGGFDQKPVHLFTILKAQDLVDITDTLNATVKTLVLTSAVSDLMKSVDWNFDGIKVYTLKTSDPANQEGFSDLAKTDHVCAFADAEGDGKVLYTFSQLLSSYPIVGNQMSIHSTAFKSAFTTKTMRDALMNAGFSFFLESQSGAFLWDVYAGGKQIQAVYSYLVLQNQVSYTLSEWIKRGQPYTDDSLLNLKGEVSRDLSTLKDQGVIAGYDIAMTWVKEQTPEDKVKGVIRGFNVNFNEQYRIAEVNIIINGEI